MSSMEASDRLLLNVITHILVNKPDNWDCGIELEFFAMACIMKGKPINIPYFIMHRMASYARKKSPLPYATFITKILKACNINPHLNKKEDSSIIDGNSLRRKNFSFVHNAWRRLGENLTIRRARERKELEIDVDEEPEYDEEVEGE